MLSNQKIQTIVTELFVSGRNLNIPLVFITQFILMHQRLLDWILLTTLSWNSKQTKKFQQIAINYSSDLDFKDFMNLYRKSNVELIILLLHQINLYVLDVISWKEYKS